MVSLHIAHVAAQLVILGLAARLHIIDSYPRLQGRAPGRGERKIMAKKKQPPQDQKSLREMTIAEVEEARHAYNRPASK